MFLYKHQILKWTRSSNNALPSQSLLHSEAKCENPTVFSSAQKPSHWTWTCYIDSLLLLRQREGENKTKKEFQKKSANLLRCRAHWNPPGWNKFNYAFINPAFKRSELLNPVRLSLPPPSHSAVRQVHALQVGAEKFRSLRKQSTQVKGRNLFQDESYCPQGLWKCFKKIQNHLPNLTKVLSLSFCTEN